MYDAYLRRVNGMNHAITNGKRRKDQADMIMNVTWNEDIQSRVAYIYDFYHDSEPSVLVDLHPENDPLKTPVDIKFIITQYSSISKDQPEYHILFRPGQEPVVDYYADAIRKYAEGAAYPVGLYIDIPDDDGIYRRWLIISYENANQFPKYSVLPCNYYFHWIYKHKKYDMAGVARLRNSYNSGEWAAYMTTSVQNQNMLWLPQNDQTVNLWYNQRFIIDSRSAVQGLDAYLTWHTSKVESTFPPGVIKLTLNQEDFDDNRDLFDPETGYLYADYSLLSEDQINTADESTGDTSEIVYKGSPNIRVAGTGKTVSITFYDKDKLPIDKLPTSSNLDDYWSFRILNEDGSEYESTISIGDLLTAVNDDVYTVKIRTDNYELIGKQLELHAHYADGTCDSQQVFQFTSL